MKCAIIFLASISLALGNPLLSYGSTVQTHGGYGGIVNTGKSQVSRQDDGHGNYAFAYDESHATGGTSRKEQGGKGWQQGSYSLRDHDGRVRVVNYVADAHGFRASIDTNEPGVDPKQDPADTQINGNGYGNGYGIAAVATAPIAISAPIAIAAPIASYGSYGGSYGGAVLSGKSDSYW